ncbi:DHH family phosphoesterase [Haladaptatus sp. CMSO5]|uniref:DHH family phosphoesterase n=1 Tax=Haladaptatus sp. CMSO5 TaxID=3120514 RepID=UPI002FCDFF53
MVFRLVLGCGSFGHSLVETIRRDSGRLLVLTNEERRVETLRSDSINAKLADPTNATAIADAADGVDVIVVASDIPGQNLASAKAARRAFPEAQLTVFTGEEPRAETLTALEEVADTLIDPSTAVTDYIIERVGDTGLRLRRLVRMLRALSGKLAVVTHDNPDPDALASAVALQKIAQAVGCSADVVYFGDITHQENRAFVNLLDLDLRNLQRGADLSEYAGFALVDHSRPGVNDQLPPDTNVDVVIDHHPPRAPIDARFVDVRSDVGATSTLLTDYLMQLGYKLDTAVATGLLYGIRVDTKDFSRDISPADFEAAEFLVPRADSSLLAQFETPSMSAETLSIIGRAIHEREVRGDVLLSGVGPISDRDALAQAADHLLNMEGITTTLVYGFKEGTVYVSARARGTDLDLGETLRDAFGQIGSAGGHADMAGAQISLGLLGDVEEGSADSLRQILTDVITDRFFDTLTSRPGQPVESVYSIPEFGKQFFDGEE